MCKPVLPLVKDAMAHVFWKAQHVATVHHHHGDHHAEEEIATSAHEEENHKHPATSKTSEPVSTHIVARSFYIFPELFLKKQKFSLLNCTIVSMFLDKKYPPPKFC